MGSGNYISCLEIAKCEKVTGDGSRPGGVLVSRDSSMPNIHSTWLDLLRWGVKKSTPSDQSRGLGSEANTYGERGGCLGKGAPKQCF
ncbi:hypothetical protein CDAR_50641 [Caerostris darwini]|uniref:Uncharacterized protein n=1 Tax=Caerostris darwini TaxID=1538125 RepID=A0AAV4UXQ7_9ARAC|nr:hypothetical protein CDAR_50641 [Caerostris darwini]